MKAPRLVKVGEDTYEVPAFIARVSFKDTSGWQVRYQGTLLFSDRKYGGVAQALQCARDELAKRLKETPYVAPVRVQAAAIAGKQNDLPAGISGPILRTRKKGSSYWGYQVTFPLRGGGTRHTCVYVGTEKNVTQQRLDDALAKAVRLRDEGVAASGRPAKLKSISQRVHMNTSTEVSQSINALAAAGPGRYKPMKDAPKDGTAILALLEGSNIPLPIRWRGPDDRMAKKGAGWYVTWDNHALQPADGPRGWLPIPMEWLPEAEPTPPIDMVLHCPVCHTQHIDAPDIVGVDECPASGQGCRIEPVGPAGTAQCLYCGSPPHWTNPPHRSHMCKECGTVWRPADVPTNGVAAVKTKGKADHRAAPPTKAG